MTNPVPYRQVRIHGRKGKGITDPYVGSVNAIVKVDGPEAPHCVYVEVVARRLAQLVLAPVAEGVLVSTPKGPAYASLEVAVPGIRLPDLVAARSYERAAKDYPDAAAAVFVYDIFIGNWDRCGNLKATLRTKSFPFLVAFDQSHALLHCESTPEKSVESLARGDLIVYEHPFADRAAPDVAYRWAERIEFLPDQMVEECCTFGRPFHGVSAVLQDNLAQALVWRKKSLNNIVMQYDFML